MNRVAISSNKKMQVTFESKLVKENSIGSFMNGWLSQELKKKISYNK